MIHAPGLLRRRAQQDAPGRPAEPDERGGGDNGDGGGWPGGLGRLVRFPRIRPATRWLIGCCLLIGALPFLTAPGNLISDTKLDLAVDPGRFLARALTLWDPQQFGQLQDQATGYLFPMGPFFYLGRLTGLEPWVIQRLWIAAVSVAAFLGVVRLAGRLGIGTPWSRIAAGFAYAASPAALTLLGVLSSEFLPAAMLPWILLPLVSAAHGGSRGRAAARSAVAVALCGGVNAAATLAVCVPAVVYILTLPRTAPRWRILAWWVPAVVLATWWWLVPLALLSRYGVSIIPYTESAAVTTSVTSLSDILRGTGNWVSYLVVNGQPWWRVGYWIATAALPTLLTGLAAGLGLAGLLRPRLPARRFLLCLLLTGVVIIAAGYVSSLGNPLAGPVDHLINGPASALRNLRKFDPLIRLPIVLGLASLLGTVPARGSTPLSRGQAPGPYGPKPPDAQKAPVTSSLGPWARPPRLRAVAVTAAVAIAGLALPAYAAGLEAAGAFPQIPPYWVSAANWLNRHAGHQAVLVVPGAAFGQYLWGSPIDDVLQPLTTVDWAQRDLSYIGSPGNERLLDAIDQRMAAGDGSAGLTQVLARMGIRYVLVRNDLIRAGLNGAWPARISEALATSPGMVRVAQFGPPVGDATPDDAATNFDPPYPAVEIYRVPGTLPVATVQPAAGTLRVYGGPEALLTLADEGLLGRRPVLLNADSPALPATGVVTDTLRRRVRNFGELRTNYSPTLTAGEGLRTFEAATDYTEPGWARYAGVARYYGIRYVTASSSAADIGAIPGQWASGLLPYSAVDGNMRTMWESGSLAGPLGQWIQIGFRAPVHPGVIEAAFTDSPALGPAVTQVAVTAATGQLIDQVQVTGRPQALRVPPGRTGWLRITVTGLAGGPAIGEQVGIREISVPGVTPSRMIVAPRVPGAAPAAVVLAKAQPQPSSCMLTTQRWVCSPALATSIEEQYGFDQGFSAPAGYRATLRGSAVLISQGLVTKYLQLIPGQARVSASSRYTRDPQDQPWSAFDGNPATTWIASPTDANPTLSITWQQPRTVRAVTIQRPPGASGHLQVLLAGDNGQARGGTVGPGGVLRFAPMRTSRLTFLFTPVAEPLQISGIVIRGAPVLATPSGLFRLPCGLGPAIELNGKVLPTQVSGTFAGLLTGLPMPFTACSGVTIARGTNRVVEPAKDAFDVQNLVLVRSGGLPPATAPATGLAASAVVRSWTPSRRVLQVTAPTRSYLVVNENFNAGWRASLVGTRERGRPQSGGARRAGAGAERGRARSAGAGAERGGGKSRARGREKQSAGAGIALRPVRIDGWKQAWLLPAHAAGTVTLTYQPDALYRDAIAGGLGTLALVMLVALWPARRKARERAWRPRWLVLPKRSRAGRSREVGAPRETVPSRQAGPSRKAVPSRQASPSRETVPSRGAEPPGEKKLPPEAGQQQAWLQRPVRLRLGWGAALTSAAAVGGLLLAGLWLGGYPGAAILTVAACLFAAAFRYQRRHRFWLELSRPWLVAGLLVAAAACGVVGERLLATGASGPLVTALTDTAPQVICLVVVARLAVALFAGDPQ